MATTPMTTQAALEALAARGILGNAVFLLDVLPLVELAWSDGEVHGSERAMILAFLDEHLRSLDDAAQETVVPRAEALRFVEHYLAERPSEAEFAELRELLRAVRLVGSQGHRNARRILDGALAVGGVAGAPGNPNRPWDAQELAKLWELEAALQVE